MIFLRATQNHASGGPIPILVLILVIAVGVWLYRRRSRNRNSVDLLTAGTTGLPSISLPGSTRILAGWWTRGGAFMVDGLIVGLPLLLANQLARHNQDVRVLGFAVTTVAALMYPALLLATQGRTVGMRWFSLEAIDLTTGRPLSTAAAWYRTLMAFCLLNLFGAISFVVVASMPPGWSSGHKALSATWTSVEFLLFLSLLIPLWDRRHQTLQDRAGRSLVVRSD